MVYRVPISDKAQDLIQQGIVFSVLTQSLAKETLSKECFAIWASHSSCGVAHLIRKAYCLHVDSSWSIL